MTKDESHFLVFPTILGPEKVVTVERSLTESSLIAWVPIHCWSKVVLSLCNPYSYYKSGHLPFRVPNHR